MFVVVEVKLRKQHIASRSGDPPCRQMKPFIFLYLQGSAEIIPAFQVNYCKLFVQPTWFKYTTIKLLAV
jgi:hypothetical protein